MKTFKRLGVLAALVLVEGSVLAQPDHRILHHFAGGPNDGANPWYGSLTPSGTTLFGMTRTGGSAGLGTVFRVNTDGSDFAILHSFAGGTADGANPLGSLALSGTTLFGMTFGGGNANSGTVFKINTDGTGFAILHAFAGSLVDGALPIGSPTLSGSVLYGTTANTVFRMDIDGNGFTVLHRFGGDGDGINPRGALILADSVLYGTASAEPFTPLGVVVFRLNTDGGNFTLLFHSGDFYGATGALTLSGSTLYGISNPNPPAGSEHPFVYRVGTDGTGFSQVFTFGDGNFAPQGPLTLSGSILYGISGDKVFQINTDGSGFSELYAVGSVSRGSLTLSGTTLYGMTSEGGDSGGGVILALNPNAPWITRQPGSATHVFGSYETFTVAAQGPVPFAYQWQRIPAGSSIWTNLRDGATYSGTDTATLTVNAPTAAMNGDLFRCVCSNSYGDDTSSTAALAVPVPLSVSTLAGQRGQSGSADGRGSAAQFNGPTDVAVDGAGNVYIADTNNHTIRKMTSTGAVTTVAGASGISGSADGAATAARFNRPAGVAVDSGGNLYVADTDNDTVRKITPAGVVSTIAGTAGTSGSADGPGAAARFDKPSGIVVDPAGNIYVADTLNHTIRAITPAGLVSTLAGAAGISGSVDDVGTAARFRGPQGLALNSAGTVCLYVADTVNSTIRKITVPTGSVVTWAGSAGAGINVDGPGYMARFDYPSAVTIDADGNLYVADTDNCAIRAINAFGDVTTIAGGAGITGGNDGGGNAVRFNHPTGIAIDNARNIYIADTDNHTVRLGILPAAPAITTQPQSQTVAAGNNVQFNVTASGQPSPTYQWNFNGTAIGGATSRSLNLANVQAANAGEYTITVSNSAGSATSNRATLMIIAASSGGSSSGGGGALEPWFAAALALLQVARRMQGRRPNVQVVAVGA